MLVRYELLDKVAGAPTGGAAVITSEMLTTVMDTIARILPTEAVRLAPSLSKVCSTSE